MQSIPGNKLVHFKKSKLKSFGPNHYISPNHRVWSYPAWDGECNMSKKPIRATDKFVRTSFMKIVPVDPFYLFDWHWHDFDIQKVESYRLDLSNEYWMNYKPYMILPYNPFMAWKVVKLPPIFRKNLWYFHSILGLAEKELFVNWIFANHIVNELIRWDKIISTLTSAKYKLEITWFIDYGT